MAETEPRSGVEEPKTRSLGKAILWLLLPGLVLLPYMLSEAIDGGWDLSEIVFGPGSGLLVLLWPWVQSPSLRVDPGKSCRLAKTLLGVIAISIALYGVLVAGFFFVNSSGRLIESGMGYVPVAFRGGYLVEIGRAHV